MLSHKIKSLLFLTFVLGIFCIPGNLTAQKSGAQKQTQKQTQKQKVQKPNKKELGGTGKQEDLFRFMGLEKPLVFRYLSLPYDAVMGTNLKEFTIELGYIFLLLLPIALFLSPKIKPFFWLSIILLLILFLSISIGTNYANVNGINPHEVGAHFNEVISNHNFSENTIESIQLLYKWPFLKLFVPISAGVAALSSTPDWLTYPLLSGIFIFLIFLLHQRYKSLGSEKKSIMLFGFFYGSLWLLLAAGLPWYGIVIFPIGILLTVYAWGKKDKGTLFPEKLKHGILYVFAGVWLLMSLNYRMSNYDASSPERAAQVFYPPLALYRTGQISEEKVIDMFRQGYPAVAKIINQETESLVYHASTQLPYFIKKSDARCFQDNFFESFISLKKKCKDDRNVMNQAFKHLGFRYFIVDLKLPLVDKTNRKTLTKKFDEFMNYMYQNPEIELVATDRQIKLNTTGQVANAVFLNRGKLVKAGSFAVYRFK